MKKSIAIKVYIKLKEKKRLVQSIHAITYRRKTTFADSESHYI